MPTTDELLARLQSMKVEVEGEYGGSLIKLDMVRVSLAKEVKVKKKRIEELTQEQVQYEAETARVLEERLAESRRKDEQIATKDRELAIKDQQIATKDRELAIKDEHIATKDKELVTKDEQIATKARLATKDAQINQLQNYMVIMETRLQESIREQQCKEAEITKSIREELRKKYQQKETGQMPLKVPLQLNWRHGPDMPFEMEGYVQSVVVLGRVYVGGGYVGHRSPVNYAVMEYDINSVKWTELPPYRVRDFAMIVINSQLVLVGGETSGNSSKMVGVWRAEITEWTRNFPEMPTARSDCSAAVYSKWLVVAGGWGDGMVRLSSVDAMNTDTKQWFAGPSMPISWDSMKTASVGDTCFFMGGGIAQNFGYATEVYSVHLPALISQLSSLESRGKNKQEQLWKEISGLQTVRSCPLSISGSLLAVGGLDMGEAVTTIMLYQSHTGKWVELGNMPNPRYNCTSTMITNKEMIVAGGYIGDSMTPQLDIAFIA